VKTPKGAPSELAFGNMSCPTAKSCWSAGFSSNTSGGTKPVVEHLVKGKFTLVHTANPKAELEGLNCPTKKDCWVVGNATAAGNTTPVIEHWNGKKWRNAVAVNPSSDDNFLTDVTCLSTKNCYAVGGFGMSSGTPAFKPLIEHWTNGKWTQLAGMPIPHGQESAVLNAISCVSAKRCMAIGTSIPNGKYFNHVYSVSFNGKKWSVVAIPQPYHQTYSYAQGSDLSCPSAKECLMDGYAAPDADGRTNYSNEIWRYHAKKWALLTVPKPVRTSAAGLDDVTCVSTTECWAVGSAFSSPGIDAAVLLRWTGGTSVSVVGVKQPKKRANVLDAVGCAAGGKCYTVGVSASETKPSVRAFGAKSG
jgi:hypothetical protein